MLSFSRLDRVEINGPVRLHPKHPVGIAGKVRQYIFVATPANEQLTPCHKTSCENLPHFFLLSEKMDTCFLREFQRARHRPSSYVTQPGASNRNRKADSATEHSCFLLVLPKTSILSPRLRGLWDVAA